MFRWNDNVRGGVIMALDMRICPICGSTEIVKKDGEWYCKSCDTFLYDKFDSEEKRVVFLSRKGNAESDLKLNPPRFDDAFEKFESLIKEFPNSSSLYWGLVRAKYGIKYEVDNDGKMVPSCYKPKYVDFRKDKAYLKAIELAESEALKEKYQKEAERIAITWKKWQTEAKKYNYDVFLSFKATDENNEETEDSKLMRELYTNLVECGFRVFYSPVSMREFVGKPYYDAYIFNALEKAEVLIVCGLKPEYLSSTWVENEWSRYLGQIQRGEKEKDSLIVLCGEYNPTEEMPRRIAYRQAFKASSRTLFSDIRDKVEETLVKARRKNALEHIEVKKVEQGVKKAFSESKLELEEVGISKIVKKSFEPAKEVRFKELSNSATGIYTPDINDKLSTASSLLKNNNFADATIFYNDCIKEDNANGKAWIGLFASKLYDYQILVDLDTNRSFKHRLLDFEECCIFEENINTIQNILEYADNKESGERFIEFLTETVLFSLFNYGNLFETAFTLFKIINSYDTGYRVSARRIVIENFGNIYKCLGGEGLDKFGQEIVDTLSSGSLEEYLKIVESLIEVFSKNDDVSHSQKWNALKLDHYEGDIKSIIRAMFYSCDALNEKSFMAKNANPHAAISALGVINKYIDKISKEDIPLLFTLLQKVERECLKNNVTEASVDNAKLYFEFLTKFKYEERSCFINGQKEYLESIAKFGRLYFAISIFEKMYSDSNNPDTMINELNNFGELLLKFGHFSIAKECFAKVFKYQENNFEALRNLVFCDLDFNLENPNEANISKLDMENFEKVLSFAPTDNQQQDFVKTILDICLALLDDLKATKESAEAISIKFNEIIKYYSADIEDQILYVNKMSILCLELGDFKDATNYSNISLHYESRNNIDARYVLLLSSLKCKNEKDFINCAGFNKDLQEYKDLLLSCSNNETKLNKYVQLANENISPNVARTKKEKENVTKPNAEKDLLKVEVKKDDVKKAEAIENEPVVLKKEEKAGAEPPESKPAKPSRPTSGRKRSSGYPWINDFDVDGMVRSAFKMIKECERPARERRRNRGK